MTELVDTWLHYQCRPIYGRTSRSGPHPDRPTILLLHGLVVSGRYLLPLADALSGSFDVHVPDLPGFGRSPGPKQPLGIVDLADAAIGWMDAARISDAVLVANSFGCQIALEAAVRYPDRVAALVLQGPSTDARARSAMEQLKRFTKNAVHESPSLFPLVLLDYLRNAKGRALKTFRAAVADPIEEKLKHVFARTLIISAEKDPISPPDWCRRIALEMPDAEHAEVESASHTLVYNEPILVARLIRHFVLGERFEGSPPVRVLIGDAPRPAIVAELDSSTAMLRAASRGLHEEAFDEPNAAPRSKGVRAGRLDRLNADTLRKWVVDAYPARSYPAMFIGSSNGAIVQLATAMGAPWLPQTFLLPVRHQPSSSELVADMEWGRRAAAPLLASNPDLSLVHAYEPSPSRLSSFRVKLLELGTIYRSFIHRCLEPGGTIYLVDCTKKWPQVKLSDRHAFQPGTPAGTAPEEFVAPRFRAPDPDHAGPEGEWGFEPAILASLMDLAQKRSYRIVRISFDEPDDLSPMVADVIAGWYRDMGFRDHHLLVGTYARLDPWWTIRTSSVPFWTSCDGSEAVERVSNYLAKSDRWRSVDLMLSSERAPIDRWQEIIRRAGTGAILESERHSRALRQQVARREWPVQSLGIERLDRHLKAKADIFHASVLTVSLRDVRTHVTMRPATTVPLSLPNW